MSQPPVTIRTPRCAQLLPRHYHLIGIAGTAMASLAGAPARRGHTVTGSDENVYPPMSDQLRELGIRYAEGYGPPTWPRARDCVWWWGTPSPAATPELEAVLEQRLPYTSAAAGSRRSSCATAFLAWRGTHGKTTTTTLRAGRRWRGRGSTRRSSSAGWPRTSARPFRLTDSPGS
jgi:UDP-N-acetylmuramate: L-alanyl-gamma-D-glutamyl-meso-diaminopimelate ligase